MNLSAGRFLVPVRYKASPYVAKFVRLFERVAERLGAQVVYCDDVRAEDLPADCPFVVVLNPVIWCYSGGFRGLLSLPRSIRVIGLWDDIHQGKGGTKYLHSDRWVLTRFFRRCDVILCTYRAPFLRWYRWHADKLVHFPMFFSLEDFQDVAFNSTPIPKCILSGSIDTFYPLRRFAARNPDVVVMAHPGYAAASPEGLPGTFGAAYARELARYRCGVTCSLVIGYAVAKYMELPAAGCLLLATYTPDLDLLGFQDGVNYIRVDEQTFDGKLAEILAGPEAFEPIRRAGFELVRSRHADVHRAQTLERLIREHCAAR